VLNEILVTSAFPNPVDHVAQRAALLGHGLNCRNMHLLSVIAGTAPKDGASDAHVQSLSECMEHVKGASASAALRYGIHCSASFDFGNLAASSMERVTQTSPLLVAVAWQSHEWWPILHNFNLLRDLARACLKPVLLVRQPPLAPYAHAVFPSDCSDESLQTLKTALRLLPGTRFTILHTYNVPGEGHMREVGIRDGVIETCRQKAESAAQKACSRLLAELRPQCGPHKPKLSLALLPKPTGLSVTNYVNAVGADVVVLSAGQKWLVEDWSWQARARDLLDKTSSDLLMISPPKPRQADCCGFEHAAR
jgi:hypothetical protein